MKTVLELSHSEARQHFLKEKSYCRFDLPPYFSFKKLLSGLSDKLGDTNLRDYFLSKPRDHTKVNYVLLNNKDGKYAWRPYQLIHPAIYGTL
jgi:RNA-directed DNA polymerase